MALVIAMAMIVGAMGLAAFAEVEDNHIQVTGLEADDTVSYAKIIQWNTTTAAWEWNTSVVETGEGKLTDADLATVVGDSETETDGVINEAMARKIAANLKSGVMTTGGTNTDGTWNSPELDLGLYIAQAVPVDAGILYNPVFLAINPPKGTGSTLDISTLTYEGSAVTKKQTTTITKTAKNKNEAQVHATDENVGDEIEFTVTTTLPVFLDNYTNPMFEVSDAMSDGLSFVDGSIKMAIAEGSAVEPTSNKWQTSDSTPKDIATFTKTDAQNWKITFDKDYLKGVGTPTNVVITYKAIITDAAKSVNPETNEAKIEYSRNPNNVNDHGEETDDTKHYTFGLDIGMQGNESYTTTEFVKVGKDKDGNYITESKNTYSNMTEQHPLEGARFILLDSEGTPYTNGTYDEATQTYTNQTIKDGAPVGSEYFTTDSLGKFAISGLEAGSYTLRETAAPAGYKKAEDTAIVITATYDAETRNLTGYTVTIGGTQAASYTIDAGTRVIESAPAAASEAGDKTTQEIVDTQGLELPSTGGIGTTIFYVVGTILVIGAGILLVTRRRMSAN